MFRQAADSLRRRLHSTPCLTFKEMSFVLGKEMLRVGPEHAGSSGRHDSVPIADCSLPTANCFMLSSDAMPGWRNGRRYGLKIR